ncbi:MAG: hypothetical protein K2K83_04970, partial [Rikenella sp.]|nr:hypothetical protein [Rikenella sp.]
PLDPGKRSDDQIHRPARIPFRTIILGFANNRDRRARASGLKLLGTPKTSAGGGRFTLSHRPRSPIVRAGDAGQSNQELVRKVFADRNRLFAKRTVLRT